MANVGVSEEVSSRGSVEALKRDLEGYREFLLPLNKVLEWEQNYYPAVLVGVITFIFAIVWYIEPSVLTTISLLGVVVSVIDFAVPHLAARLFGSSEWGVVQERQFEAICGRIHHAKQHLTDTCNYVARLKKDKPTAYVLLLVGTFAVLAWLGSLIDNLLLTYLFVVIVSMVPGLRKRGILQMLTSKVKDAIGGIKKAAPEKPKIN